MLQHQIKLNSGKSFHPQGFAFINIFGLSVGLTCFGTLLLKGGTALAHRGDLQLVRLSASWDDRSASLQGLSVDFSPVLASSLRLFEGANPTLWFVAMVGFLVIMMGLKVVFGESDQPVKQ